MTARAKLALLALLLTSIGGCSLIVEDPNLTQEQGCRACHELNRIEIPPECMGWVCSSDDPSEGRCVLGVLDDDGDGYENASCVPADADPPPDCDDRDATASPGLDEACGDAVDNDCDTRVDEGCDDAGP